LGKIEYTYYHSLIIYRRRKEMKLLITAMLVVGTLSMAMFIGAFQACTNQSKTVDAVVSDTSTEDVTIDTIEIVDSRIYDIVATDELVDVKEEVEVLVFTEEETEDVLYGDEE